MSCKLIVITMLSLREKVLCLFLAILFASVFLRSFEMRLPTESPSENHHMNAPYRRYLVNSRNCKIPDLNPFYQPLNDRGFMDKSPNYELKPPLTYLHYDWKSGEVSLRVNVSLLGLYSTKTLKCCVSPIHDTYWPKLKVGKCAPFSNNFTLDYNHERVLVKCFDDKNHTIYQNSHITVVERLNKTTKTAKPNVLLIGMDSVSRLSMYRNMPKTVRYLQTSGWVEMRGYNKIGDNSVPNMMALLTGLAPHHFDDLPGKSVFDYYPFVWKRFSSHGYVTAYAEDEVNIETFNGYNKGFFGKPTDYYPRSFFSYRSRKKQLYSGFHSMNSAEILFQYLHDFVRVYRNDSFFGLFYTNMFHNEMNSPSTTDDTLLELLKRLGSLGTFNNSFVALFSDHGLRVGVPRTTSTGWYEDRLPLLFISVPEWFELSNRSAYSTLLDNSERLTSPFDLYLTLDNILQETPEAPPEGCKSCKSLFDSIDENRSCSEAGISRHWCTCSEFLDIEIDEKRKYFLGNVVVEAINSKLERDSNIIPKCRCKPLELSKILYVRKRKSVDESEEFLVGIETNPGGGKFEMTVNDFESAERHYETISRLNEFGNSSHCATKPSTKHFCFCECEEHRPI